MGARRKSQDQYPRIRITESGDRLAPVIPVHEAAELLTRNFFAILDQARTTSASDDLAIEDAQPIGERGGVNLISGGKCTSGGPLRSAGDVLCITSGRPGFDSSAHAHSYIHYTS